MKVVFGCPVVDRAWILPEWLAAIDAQEIDDYEIACVVGPCTDGTERILLEHPRCRVWRTNERRSQANVRSHSWPEEDLRVISSARNLLRSRVLAAYEFDYYFSLDSDIILEPDVTRTLLGGFVDWDGAAASPLVKMTPEGDGQHLAWNYMHFVEGSEAASRPGIQPAPTEPQVVDVLMAAILMRREVLELSHWDPHPQGEDVAWSRLARHHGWNLLLDPTVKGDHRMHAPALTSSSSPTGQALT